MQDHRSLWPANRCAAKPGQIAFPRVGTGWHCVPRKVRFSIWLFSKTKRPHFSDFSETTTLRAKRSNLFPHPRLFPTPSLRRLLESPVLVISFPPLPHNFFLLPFAFYFPSFRCVAPKQKNKRRKCQYHSDIHNTA